MTVRLETTSVDTINVYWVVLTVSICTLMHVRPNLVMYNYHTQRIIHSGSAHGCPVDGVVLTLMFSSAAIVRWASSNSELSWDTWFSKYFLSLLRLSDCERTHTAQVPFTWTYLMVCECSDIRVLLLLLSPRHFLPLYVGVPPAGYWPAWFQSGSLGGYKTQRETKKL